MNSCLFNFIVIVEKSKIIREGIIALLNKHNLGCQIAQLDSFKEWNEIIGDSIPDLIISNHELVKSNVDKLRQKYSLSPKSLFVGLVYSYYAYQEINDIFDEIIYITDSEDVFSLKLRNLSHKAEVTYLSQQGSEEKLTDREKDVLRLLLQGYSNKEVADKLVISPHTVITHRKNVVEKTGIRSLSGLAVYGILNNIIEMDDIRN